MCCLDYIVESFDTKRNFFYIYLCAGVVKLVDARDSKSREPQAHVGSIPTSGTILVQSNTIGAEIPFLLFKPNKLSGFEYLLNSVSLRKD